MKSIINETQPIGGDGAVATESLMVDGGNLIADIQVKYPLAKLLTPVNAAIDKGIDSLEAIIPGDWDMALLEPVRAAIKAEIVALVGSI